VRCSVVQCGGVRRSAAQCSAVCCSVLQCVVWGTVAVVCELVVELCLKQEGVERSNAAIELDAFGPCCLVHSTVNTYTYIYTYRFYMYVHICVYICIYAASYTALK